MGEFNKPGNFNNTPPLAGGGGGLPPIPFPGFSWRAVPDSSITVNTDLGPTTNAAPGIETYEGVDFLTSVIIPSGQAVVIDSQSVSGVNITGTPGAGKTITVTITGGLISAIAIS